MADTSTAPGAQPPTPAQPDPATVAFIYEATRDAPLAIIRQGSDVNGRALNLLAVGAVLLGAVAVSVPKSSSPWWLVAPVVGSVLAFLALAVSAWGCLRLRGMRPATHADSLWADFYDQPVWVIHRALVADIAAATTADYAILHTKNRWLERVVWAVSAEALLVALSALAVLVAGGAL